MLGAEVIACTSSEKKMQQLKELGADEVINYNEVDFSRWAVEKYGKPQRRSYEGGVDVVINFTGGDTWHPSLRCLKRGGKLLVCGATAGYDPKEDLRYIWSFELKIIGSNSFYDDNLQALMKLIAEQKMRPVIDKVLPLEAGARGTAADREPRSDRQGRGRAVNLALLRDRRGGSQELASRRIARMLVRRVAGKSHERRNDAGAGAGAGHPRAVSSVARIEGHRGA